MDLTVSDGMTLSLVGESGCGKTTFGKAVLRLLQPTSGSVIFDGVNLARLSRSRLRRFRKNFQIVFQDPFSSLNPRMMVKDIILEPMLPHGIGGSHGERMNMVSKALESVGLDTDMLYRYPHEFSGGQRQRIAIARVLTLKPRLLVCDEATSALDPESEREICQTLGRLRGKLTILAISHQTALLNAAERAYRVEGGSVRSIRTEEGL